MPLSVSFRTSSVWVTSVSQLPICEMPWPKKNRRKLRCATSGTSRRRSRAAGGHRGSCRTLRDALEDVERVGDPFEVLGGKVAQLRREPRGAAGAARFELTPALRGRAHAADAPVVLVADAFEQTLAPRASRRPW